METKEKWTMARNSKGEPFIVRGYGGEKQYMMEMTRNSSGMPVRPSWGPIRYMAVITRGRRAD